MLEFYPPAPGSFNQGSFKSEPGQPLPAVPPIPFRLTADNNNAEPSVSVKTESGLLETICAGCGRTIADKYVMRVAERNYHEECLSCTACGAMLSHSCFIRDLKLYCRSDYEKIFGVKCARCMEKISCSDLVMRVASLVFHVECFMCCMCGQPLPRGAHFILRQGQPICRRDFEHELYLNSPQDDDLLDENRPRDGRRGPKRPRTILTSAQRRQFKASFEVSPKPCRKVREALAKDTGLSVRVVQVWFQNQRAKMKKLQRKAKTEPGSDKEPKEERRTESPHSDHSHYLNALNMRDGESSSFPSATQPLNPNNPYSPDDAYPGHSGESFCSSDLSLDGTEAGFDIGENDGGGADGSHQGASHSHHGSSSHDTPSLSQSLHAAIHNPIDKLFMMQSSYFSGDHA
ncbi:LIM homeobox transcription factor 1-beta isoform X1 [Harpegnathos saltator]|uniref:LIM homeobox transcription factor 1 beta n=1 Tax=Harpegnathos saltator TaxID=610380 RepID=E2BM86_HARSA|nr:LIM homeobox transcription factor 1-beta isoform X1 [Harpegnathos saltator]EFN83212.1 LIM homeobox transcription factor 1 beta [Harpegnathos saltator]